MASAPKRVLRVTKEAEPYRTELTPVSFLRRTAYVFPDKVAVVHGVKVIRVDDTGSGGDPFEDSRAAQSAEPCEPWIADEMETISINYTSGTTGRPKGVMIHHRGAYLNAMGEVVETGMGFEAKYLWTLPMFHCNGWCFTWGVTAMAGTHVCLRRVESSRIWDLIDKEGLTHFFRAPTG